MIDYQVSSPTGAKMLSDLPSLYEPILEMRVIVQTNGEQLDDIKSDLEDQLNQKFVGTATWGLENWEDELGIVPPAGQPIDQRRSVIRSRMRGAGKFSGRLMKNVAESYDKGSVDVSFNPALSLFSIKFIDTLGLPPNIDDLKSAIDQIVPAHLYVQYSYRYLTIAEVEGMTIAQIESTTLDRFAGGGI